MPNIQIRAIDEGKRYAEFVATTERAVDTWGGPETLLMDSVDLTRYEANGVVLDTHNRQTVEDIVGRAKVWCEEDKMIAGVTFTDATARGEAAWQLTKTGFVNAMSIGYIVRAYEEVKAGQTLERGGRKYQGPVRLATDWELLEVSLVPVPADKDALRRAQEGAEMADEKEDKPEVKTPEEAPKVDALTGHVEDRAAKFEARKREVLARCGERHRELAEDLMLRDSEATADGIIEKLIKDLEAKAAPLGTPEPKPPADPDAKEEEKKETTEPMFEKSALIEGIREMK